MSLSSLASAVAREGAIGVISGVQIGYDEPDFLSNNNEIVSGPTLIFIPFRETKSSNLPFN